MSFPPMALCALVSVFYTLLGLTSASALEKPLRIMPLGDSITFGESLNSVEQGGYRDRLYSLLTAAPYNFNLDFVGTKTDTNNPQLPDKNHQGMPGWRVDELLFGGSGATYGIPDGNIDTWLEDVDDPDVILLLCGTNDFIQYAIGPRIESVAGVLSEMDQLIDRIAEKLPYTKIIVSTLVRSGWPVGINGINVENLQTQFNSGLIPLVAQHVAKGQQVSLVDMHPVLSLPNDFWDGVHPTGTGYNKMADTWAPAIANVISSKGTTNPPMIAHVDNDVNSNEMTVTFSKPVADTANTLSNFSLSGGLTISSAVLDTTTKRTVTLTTSTQTAGVPYVLTVSGVRDRTTGQTLIAPQSMALSYSAIPNNGGFENSYTGWTQSGNQQIVTTTASPYIASEGSKMVVFNGGDQTPNGVLSQTFATTPGRNYRLTFRMGTASWRSSWAQSLSVSVKNSSNNSLLQQTATVSGTGGNGKLSWFPWEYDFTANSSTTTLKFTDVSSAGGSTSLDMLLDRIAVTPPPSLNVTSTPNAGVNITLSINDLDGNGSGTTGLIRTYNPDTTITLTAPGTSGGANFVKWQVNGADLSTNNAVTISLNSNTTLNAVYNSNGVPTPIAVNDTYSTNEDSSLVVSASGVLANDSNGGSGSLTAIKNTNPSNGVVTLNSNGGFTYTPTANYNGSDSFTYHVNNGTADSNIATVNITVNSVNDAPVAVDDGSVGSTFLTVTEDSGLSSSMFVLSNDTDVDGDPLTITQASSPNGTVSVTNSNTRLKFTPAADFSGMTTISYTISDGNGGTAVATVYIFVTPVNDAPVAIPQNLVTNEDTALSITLTGTDVDGPSMSFAKTSPSHGTLTGTAPNLTYTPAANYFGSDSFTFTVNDGSLTSAPATISITVNAVNDAPVAVAQNLTTNEDTALSILLTGTDVDGPSMNFAKTSPSHGTLTGTAQNLTYTPAMNYFGIDSFTFTVNDGSLTSVPATISITINPINDAPIAVNDGSLGSPFLTVTEDSGLSSSMFVLSNDTDVDGDPLTITQASSPNGTVSVTNSNTRLKFTPAADFSGATTISYTISDGKGGTAVGTAFIYVTPVNDAPVAVDDGSLGSPFLTLDEDSNASFLISTVLSNDSDVDGDSLTITSKSSPNGSVVSINSNTKLKFTPDANFNGTTTISYTISDGNGGTAVGTIFVYVNPVNDAPVAVAQSLSTNEDTALPITLTGTDIDGDTLTTFNIITQPLNGTLSGSGANWTYTPDENYHGNDSFTFKVSDAALQSTLEATISITINPVNDAPVAVAQSLSTDEDTALQITLTGTDVDGETLSTFSIIAQPLNGTLSGSGANRTYTPNENYHGSDSFTFKVSDASLESTLEATISITIGPVNDAPVAVAQNLSTNEDTALPITLTGTDIDGDPLTAFSIIAQPLNGTLSGSGANRTYTPNENYHGSDSFTFKVSDASLESTLEATISITIGPVNDAPVAVAQSLSTNEDTALPITLTGTDIDGDPLTAFSIIAQPLNGTLSGSGANRTYTPNENYHGSDSFTFKVSDASLESTLEATVSIMIDPVNDAPVAVAQSLSTNEDTALPITLTGTDIDGDPLTTFNIISQPLNGTLSGSAANWTYTPDENYHGSDSFTFKVSDASLESTLEATVSIVINPVNDAPLAVAQSLSTDEDTALPITLTGTDVDGDTLSTFNIIAQPLNGTLSGSGANWTYTPNENYHGSDSFTFKVSDAALESTLEATVSIMIDPVNDAPVAVAQNLNTDEDSSLPITLTGTDVDGDTLATFNIIAQPLNGTLSGSGANQTYTPNENYHGSDSFTFKVSDAALQSTLEATISITINPANDAPVAVAQSLSTNEDTALQITLTGTDVDGETLSTFSIIAQPLNGTLTGSGANQTYTPNENYHGSDSFTFKVSDASLESTLEATISITINPINDKPTALAQSRALDEDSSLPILLAGTDVENSTLTFTHTPPAHGTLTGIAPNLTYTPFADYYGPDSFTFTVSDGNLTSNSAAITITVNPLEEFSQWLSLSGLMDGPTDDPDNDSISNAVEYVIGSNPAGGSNSTVLPSITMVTADLDGNPGDEEYLCFTYRRTNLAKNDPSTSIKVQWAESLTGPWHNADGTQGEVTDVVIDGAETGIDLVNVHIPRSLESNGGLFTRLVVTVNPPAPDE